MRNGLIWLRTGSRGCILLMIYLEDAFQKLIIQTLMDNEAERMGKDSVVA
jgi:hypothetical protein